MSEYQSYQWECTTKRLTPEQRHEVSDLSSHIDVTACSAQVSYHYSDFKHDPIKVLLRYFDVFTYEANWGTQRIALRFDTGSIDLETLEKYAVNDIIEIKATDKHILVGSWFDENGLESCYYDPYDEDQGICTSVATVHQDMLDGDFRGIFLLWLKACELSSEAEHIHAPIPPGMAQLTHHHQELADFIGIDHELIAQTAKLSKKLPARTSPKNSHLAAAIGQLPKADMESYLKRLLSEDAHTVQAALRHQIAHSFPANKKQLHAKPTPYKTLATNLQKAKHAEQERIAQEKAIRRKQYLKELADREDELWDRVQELIAHKQTKAYDEAILLLRGMEDLYTTRKDLPHFHAAIHIIANTFPRLTGLRGRLEKSGWLEEKKPTIYSESNKKSWQEKNPLQREINF